MDTETAEKFAKLEAMVTRLELQLAAIAPKPPGKVICMKAAAARLGISRHTLRRRALADLLAANLIKALRRQAELLDLPLDPADSRLNRRIAEVANQTVNAVVRAQEKSLAAKRDEEHDRAMEALFEERMKKAQLEIDRLNAAPRRFVVTYK